MLWSFWLARGRVGVESLVLVLLLLLLLSMIRVEVVVLRLGPADDVLLGSFNSPLPSSSHVALPVMPGMKKWGDTVEPTEEDPLVPSLTLLMLLLPEVIVNLAVVMGVVVLLDWVVTPIMALLSSSSLPVHLETSSAQEDDEDDRCGGAEEVIWYIG